MLADYALNARVSSWLYHVIFINLLGVPGAAAQVQGPLGPRGTLIRADQAAEEP